MDTIALIALARSNSSGGGGKGGINVVANPEEEATADLNKLQVRNGIYKIPDGEITENLTTAIKVGGIESGTEYTKGTSFEKILSDMLTPVLYPTLSSPSVSLSGSGSKLLETGATQSVTLTASFSRGSISPAYGTSGYRAGTVTGYKLNNGSTQSGNTWSTTVSASNRTFKVTASYGAGEQPKDSKGNDYGSPLPAGTVSSGNVIYDFVDALWSNVSNISTVSKMSLISKSTKQKDFVFPDATELLPEIFDVPASWTVTAIQVKNDLSGAFEDASDQFDITDVTHNNAGGVSVNYKRYTCNLGIDIGSRTIRIKWS